MRRLRGRHVFAVLLLLLGVLVVREVTCGRWPRGDVAMPPVEAGPIEVVRAYVAALDKHDVDTANALSTPQHSDRNPWLSNTSSITDLEVREPIPDSDGGMELGMTESVFVGVTFDLDMCDWDGSMQEGETPWGYRVGRDRATGRWLVFSEGVV